MKKSKILFVNAPNTVEDGRCRSGESLTGALIATALREHPIYNIEVIYTDSQTETLDKIASYMPDAIIFNFHPGVNPWMEQLNIRELYPHIKSLRFVYDDTVNVAKKWNPYSHPVWQYMLTFDSFVEANEFVFPTTHVLPNGPSKPYLDRGVPVFGWQGFPAPWKGVHRIAEAVQREFDEAIIRLHMPDGFFTQPKNVYGPQIVEHARSIVTKPGIRFEVSNDWLDEQGIIDWLGQNTVNCYFYDYLDGAGFSGSIDYAMAAHRPIAITKSHQFKTFWNLEPTIIIENTTLKQIIANDITPLKPIYKKFNKEQLWEDYTKIFEGLGL
jgi:hypothetical protein